MNVGPFRAPLVVPFIIPIVASLSLGLAPFTPEPHLVGKLRWLAGGAVGMGGADWFDLDMHGAPWLWLIVVAVQQVRRRPGSGR